MRLSTLPLALLALLAAARLAPAAERRPNIVLIVADDLGYAEVGCYGQKKIKTPHLDRMARQGLRFTQFYAGSPVCAPSRCSLMTGKHGGHAYIRTNKEAKPEGQEPVPASEVMLSELVKKQGHVTAAMGKWGLGPPGSVGDPLKRGFDHFFGYNCQRHAHSHYPAWLYDDAKRLDLKGNDGKKGPTHSHELFEKRALAFIRDNQKRPFFLYLPFTIPHVAIHADDPWLAEYKGKFDETPYDGKKGYQKHPTPRAGYAAMITRMDLTVGRILDLLEQLKLDRDTLVMFTSDNGATHDVGGADTVFFNSVGNLRGRKGSVYEGGLRVPMIAWWPGTIKAGRVTDHASYFPDVLPTVMDALGAAKEVPKGVNGLSFLPTLRGEAGQKAHAHLFWEFAGYGGQQAVRMGDWKGVRQGLQKGVGKLQLYNLKDDVGETTDVAAKHPDIVKKIETILATDRTPSKVFPIKGLEKKK